MKTITFCLTAGLMAFSYSTFAEKIIITGQPVILEQTAGVYALPKGYKASTDYYYVTINGENKVCYLTEQPSLASLNNTSLDIQIGDTKAKLNCYNYDNTYFILK